MRKTVIFLALLLAAGCVHQQRPGPAPRYYEAYYDGFYGPFIDGYWGRDPRYFWYMDKNKIWHRDIAHHFQRGDGGVKWAPVRGSGTARVR
jgi:hypothetical protein